MTSFRTLVAAVDFSDGSVAAARQAATLAAQTGAALHLVHADVLFHASGQDAPQAVPSGHHRLRLERFAATVLEDETEATLAVERGVAVPRTLLRYSARVGADLLVLGSHGRGRLARMLLGSVAEATVAAASCPVLTVPSPEAPAPGPDAPVVVGVDFSERSRDALGAGAALAAATDAPLEIVHVVRGSGPYPGLAPDLFSLWDLDPQAAETARARLLRVAADTPVAKAMVAYGAPGRALPELAAVRRAGALVVGTHGRGDLARALLGSVAQEALRRAPCPVLSVSQAGLSTPLRVGSALGTSSL